MSNSKKSWDSQAKWENSGKDGNDNYQAKDGYYKEKVGTGKAFAMQEKAMKGSSSGSTQHSGDAIPGWNQPVSKGKAYSKQQCWGMGKESEVKVNLGENAGHLGHFNSAKILDEGHNDSGPAAPGYSYPDIDAPQKPRVQSDDYRNGRSNYPKTSPTPSPSPGMGTDSGPSDVAKKAGKKAFNE